MPNHLDLDTSKRASSASVLVLSGKQEGVGTEKVEFVFVAVADEIQEISVPVAGVLDHEGLTHLCKLRGFVHPVLLPTRLKLS